MAEAESPAETNTESSLEKTGELKTADTQQVPATSAAEDFARQAEEAPPGLIAEFVDFLIHNKKWWLTPIILVMLLLTLVAFFSGSAAAPFMYTIF